MPPTSLADLQNCRVKDPSIGSGPDSVFHSNGCKTSNTHDFCSECRFLSFLFHLLLNQVPSIGSGLSIGRRPDVPCLNGDFGSSAT